MNNKTDSIVMYIRTGLVWFLCFLFLGCADSQGVMESKLDVILQDDLRFMVAELRTQGKDSAIIDQPYYQVEDLRFFSGDSARMFAGYAAVSFYYYKNIKMKELRKYRYNTTSSFWDRYFKKLVHFDYKLK